MGIMKTLKKIGTILFYSPSDERPSYDLYKTVAELSRLTNEVTGRIAELKYDFDEHAIASHFEPEVYQRMFGRTFHYTQMELSNQLVNDIVKRKTHFMEQFERCHALFTDNKIETYRREKEATISDGRNLLNEIQRTSDKLPLSMGVIEF
jgi:hypothetical protein